ncbi:hypothetical protein [Priestia megaterium]|uniref:hypothetical protein n=1 Tax=Priestia megaterium TaxID=1404 RepID=UPI00186421B2|nr:hypothetical protein [Priestia megaterium]
MGGQGEDSCGKSVRDEKAHRPPAESEVLHGNQQRCHKLSIRANVSICSSLDWIHLVMSRPHFLNF